MFPKLWPVPSILNCFPLGKAIKIGYIEVSMSPSSQADKNVFTHCKQNNILSPKYASGNILEIHIRC